MCPVSLRETGDGSGGTRVSAVFVRMGAPGVGVAERLAQVTESMNAAKEDVRAMSRETALGYAACRPWPITWGGRGAISSRQPKADP